MSEGYKEKRVRQQRVKQGLCAYCGTNHKDAGIKEACFNAQSGSESAQGMLIGMLDCSELAEEGD